MRNILVIRETKISAQAVRLMVLKEIFNLLQEDKPIWSTLVCEPVENQCLKILGRINKGQRKLLMSFVFNVLEDLILEKILNKNENGYYFLNLDYDNHSKWQEEISNELENSKQLVLQLENKPIYSEGLARTVTETEYERSSKARAICLSLYGFDCAVCGFSFEKIFGDIGRQWIHVHHLNPISQGERSTDPQKDLRPVCPNCHAMLHRRNPPFSIEELQEMKSRNKQA